MTPWERYQADLRRPEFAHDPAQEMAIRHLQNLYDALLQQPQPSTLGRLLDKVRKRPKEPVKGLYFWGGVGRGKTYLVDTFYGCLPFEQKKRLHFHRFMQLVHNELKSLKNQQDPLKLVARRWAEDTRVICFDEFFVSDIADAMILGGLLAALFEEGVTLVATSNIPPDELYAGGLQRARFLPAIELIKRHTEVVNVDSGVDYRLRYLEQVEIYHVPADAQSEQLLADEFVQIAGEQGEANTRLEVEGRWIPVRRVAKGVIWFDFDAICDGPRGQADYIELARLYHTVLISGVPVFPPEHDDRARRFMALVDEFYDRDVKLICTAAAPPEQLYRGERLAFAFQRTVSRLTEMQSREYLARPHRP